MTTDAFNNRISPQIPPADDQAIEGFLTGLETTLASHCVDIGSEDPRGFARMGDKSFVWVGEALECAEANPALCPGFLDVVEFKRDVDGATYFTSVERRLEALLHLVRSSNLLCRHDAYKAGLTFYSSAQNGVKVNLPGAKAVVARLSPQFVSRSNRPAPPAGDDDASS